MEHGYPAGSYLALGMELPVQCTVTCLEIVRHMKHDLGRTSGGTEGPLMMACYSYYQFLRLSSGIPVFGAASRGIVQVPIVSFGDAWSQGCLFVCLYRYLLFKTAR
jgi:hypothetical protein